jgi:CheY-like chemotaxis protein
MKKKLNTILLVDDDKDCNFFHQRLINKLNCVDHLNTVNDGQEAIEFLNSTQNGKHPRPDIIFLDLNMPRMTGWEFLEEYEKLEVDKKAKIIVVMLATALHTGDTERIKKYHNIINGYKKKYLDKEAMDQILKEHFQDYL